MKGFILLSFVFVLLSCSATKKKSQEDFIKDQVQLDLQDKMKPSRIEASFPSLGLSYLCTISKEKNIVIFSFDSEQKSLEQVIDFLDKEVGVVSVSRTAGCK